MSNENRGWRSCPVVVGLQWLGVYIRYGGHAFLMLVHFHYSIGRVLVGNLDWRAGWPRKRRNWTHMAATPEAWTSRVPARCDNDKSCLHERRADGPAAQLSCLVQQLSTTIISPSAVHRNYNWSSKCGGADGAVFARLWTATDVNENETSAPCNLIREYS